MSARGIGLLPGLLAAALALALAPLCAQSAPVLEAEPPGQQPHSGPEHDEDADDDDDGREERVDPRLRAALEAEGFEYTVSRGGDLQVLIHFNEDDRSQYVRLQSSTRRFRNIEYRDVYSTAFHFDAAAGLDAALARRLLESNNTFTLGFWALQDDVVFSIARIPAQASPAMVREAIGFVAAEADELEKELLGSDDY